MTQQDNQHSTLLLALQQLADTYGMEKMTEAAEAMLGQLEASKQLPAEYARLLSPEQLQNTAIQLDSAMDDIIVRGQEKENCYGNKGELVSQKINLDNQIKINEAVAMVNGGGDAKVIVYEGVTYPFNNEAARDAFRRFVTKELRKQRAELEGEIVKADLKIEQAKDNWNAAVQASHLVQAKANAQAALLNWLAGKA